MLLAADQHVVGIHAGLLGLADDCAPEIILADHAEQCCRCAQTGQVLGHVARATAYADLHDAGVRCAGDNIAKRAALHIQTRCADDDYFGCTVAMRHMNRYFFSAGFSGGFGGAGTTGGGGACCVSKLKSPSTCQSDVAVIALTIRSGVMSTPESLSALMISVTRLDSASTSALRTFRIRRASRSDSICLTYDSRSSIRSQLS